MSKSRNRPQAKSDVKQITPENIKLDENDALKLALAHERAEHAITVAKQRDAERVTTLTALQARYSEGGKYIVLEINAAAGTLKRVTAEEASRLQAQQETPTN